MTAAGRYCWRAEFAGDADIGLMGSEDSSAGECFLVKPVKPTISTMAGAGPVDFGQPVTDTATLTGTAHKPGTGGPTGSALAGSINPTTLGGDATGTITFTLYKDDGCTAPNIATGTGTNPQTVNVSGDGSYGPVSFTPDAPGTYRWVAIRTNGDAPNTLASDAGACNDANEDVVVRQIPTEIKTQQSWYPNDTAEIKADDRQPRRRRQRHVQPVQQRDVHGHARVLETSTTRSGAAARRRPRAPATRRSRSPRGSPTPPDSVDGAVLVEGRVHAGGERHGPHSACRARAAEFFNITYTNDNGPGTALP